MSRTTSSFVAGVQRHDNKCTSETWKQPSWNGLQYAGIDAFSGVLGSNVQVLGSMDLPHLVPHLTALAKFVHTPVIAPRGMGDHQPLAVPLSFAKIGTQLDRFCHEF